MHCTKVILILNNSKLIINLGVQINVVAVSNLVNSCSQKGIRLTEQPEIHSFSVTI